MYDILRCNIEANIIVHFYFPFITCRRPHTCNKYIITLVILYLQADTNEFFFHTCKFSKLLKNILGKFIVNKILNAIFSEINLMLDFFQGKETATAMRRKLSAQKTSIRN